MVPDKHDATFNSDKTYLLVGCLGGLGRTIATWMIKRGARKLLFLNRSGTEKKSAMRLVEDLQEAGADVKIVRGDVSSLPEVKGAMSQISGPIGGVVHAAMSLDVSPF